MSASTSSQPTSRPHPIVPSDRPLPRARRTPRNLLPPGLLATTQKPAYLPALTSFKTRRLPRGRGKRADSDEEGESGEAGGNDSDEDDDDEDRTRRYHDSDEEEEEDAKPLLTPTSASTPPAALDVGQSLQKPKKKRNRKTRQKDANGPATLSSDNPAPSSSSPPAAVAAPPSSLPPPRPKPKAVLNWSEADPDQSLPDAFFEADREEPTEAERVTEVAQAGDKKKKKKFKTKKERMAAKEAREAPAAPVEGGGVEPSTSLAKVALVSTPRTMTPPSSQPTPRPAPSQSSTASTSNTPTLLTPAGSVIFDAPPASASPLSSTNHPQSHQFHPSFSHANHPSHPNAKPPLHPSASSKENVLTRRQELAAEKIRSRSIDPSRQSPHPPLTLPAPSHFPSPPPPTEDIHTVYPSDQAALLLQGTSSDRSVRVNLPLVGASSEVSLVDKGRGKMSRKMKSKKVAQKGEALQGSLLALSMQNGRPVEVKLPTKRFAQATAAPAASKARTPTGPSASASSSTFPKGGQSKPSTPSNLSLPVRGPPPGFAGPSHQHHLPPHRIEHPQPRKIASDSSILHQSPPHLDREPTPPHKVASSASLPVSAAPFVPSSAFYTTAGAVDSPKEDRVAELFSALRTQSRTEIRADAPDFTPSTSSPLSTMKTENPPLSAPRQPFQHQPQSFSHFDPPYTSFPSSPTQQQQQQHAYYPSDVSLPSGFVCEGGIVYEQATGQQYIYAPSPLAPPAPPLSQHPSSFSSADGSTMDREDAQSPLWTAPVHKPVVVSRFGGEGGEDLSFSSLANPAAASPYNPYVHRTLHPSAYSSDPSFHQPNPYESFNPYAQQFPPQHHFYPPSGPMEYDPYTPYPAPLAHHFSQPPFYPSDLSSFYNPYNDHGAPPPIPLQQYYQHSSSSNPNPSAAEFVPTAKRIGGADGRKAGEERMGTGGGDEGRGEVRRVTSFDSDTTMNPYHGQYY